MQLENTAMKEYKKNIYLENRAEYEITTHLGEEKIDETLYCH